MATESTFNVLLAQEFHIKSVFHPSVPCACAFVTYIAREQTHCRTSFVPWCQQVRWGQGSFLSPTIAPCTPLLLLWYYSKHSFLEAKSVSPFSPAAVTENLPLSCPKLNKRKKSKQQRNLLSFTTIPFQELLLPSIGPSNKSTPFHDRTGRIQC